MAELLIEDVKTGVDGRIGVPMCQWCWSKSATKDWIKRRESTSSVGYKKPVRVPLCGECVEIVVRNFVG